METDLRDLAEKLRADGPTDCWTLIPKRYKTPRVARVIASQIRYGQRSGWGPAGTFDAEHVDDVRVRVRYRGEPDATP